MFNFKNLIVFFLILIASNSEANQFNIISDDRDPPIKRTVKVNIDNRVTGQQLSKNAQEIKSLDKKPYEKIHVLYYLPGQKNIWACVRFEPYLKVQIFGATSEQIKEFRKFSIKTDGWQIPIPPARPGEGIISRREQPTKLQYDGKIIGEWISESGKITVFKKDNKTFFNQYFGGNKQITIKMKSTQTSKGLRLDDFNELKYKSGLYHLINKKRELETWDNDRRIGEILPPV